MAAIRTGLRYPGGCDGQEGTANASVSKFSRAYLEGGSHHTGPDPNDGLKKGPGQRQDARKKQGAAFMWKKAKTKRLLIYYNRRNKC